MGVRPVSPCAGSDPAAGWLGTLLQDMVEEDTALTLLGPFRLKRVSEVAFGALHSPSVPGPLVACVLPSAASVWARIVGCTGALPASASALAHLLSLFACGHRCTQV